VRACLTRAAKAARYSRGVTRRLLGVVIAAPLRVLAISSSELFRKNKYQERAYSVPEKQG
jgi:hypothetical protein